MILYYFLYHDIANLDLGNSQGVTPFDCLQMLFNISDPVGSNCL